jgi:hypothetical protein
MELLALKFGFIKVNSVKRLREALVDHVRRGVPAQRRGAAGLGLRLHQQLHQYKRVKVLQKLMLLAHRQEVTLGSKKVVPREAV